MGMDWKTIPGLMMMGGLAFLGVSALLATPVTIERRMASRGSMWDARVGHRAHKVHGPRDMGTRSPSSEAGRSFLREGRKRDGFLNELVTPTRRVPRSSVGQSAGLLIRWPGVRFPPREKCLFVHASSI